MADLYIGLMSGTSVDGIDAALVDFSTGHPSLIVTHYTPYNDKLRQQILALCAPGENEIHRLGELDHLLGKAFAESVNALLLTHQVPAKSIRAIGSHGQTIRHCPEHTYPFTLQIGDPNIIAAETGITTIADFRRRDIAHGGQGAPLVPAFHQAVFSSKKTNRIIVNIGGIANITLLPASQPANLGFDTGPGNTLLDTWIERQQNKRCDVEGNWARQGHCHQTLLETMLADAYFSQAAPKSTGREYFNLAWIQHCLSKLSVEINPVDVQATLVELTAHSILQAIKNHLTAGEIIVCGGGVYNRYLMARLQRLAQAEFTVHSTSEYGIDPAWVEAIAFAWFARETLNKRTSNLPAVTGAKKAAILGGIYLA